MDRNCDKCIHHTSGMCDSWDCKMQTVEGLKKEVREKAIEEFAERLKRRYPIASNGLEMAIINSGLHKNIEEVAKELKGE